MLLIILALFLVAGSAWAIITADNATAETDPFSVNGFNWNYVFSHPDGSCVAVAPNWILTASHVAGYGGSGTLTITGTNYLKKEIIFHDNADIALVRYDKPFPGYYGLHSGVSLLNANVVMVGFGNTGTVTKTFGQYYYTDSGSGRNVRRWGSNKISSIETWDYSVPPAFTNSGFVMRFDAAGTEAGVGTYDSGSGSFVQEGGEWKLAGINTSRGSNLWGYDKTFAVSAPAYADWINSIIIGTNDLDGDGLPNYWEQQYSTTTTGLVASADNDNDGFLNEEEYIADTNPTNAASFFEMSGFLASTNQTVLFNGSTGRLYQVYYTTSDLAATNLAWIAAGNPAAGTGTTSSITVTNTTTKAFYRLKVSLP